MSEQVKKDTNQGNKIAVEVNVAEIVRHLCITGIIIVSIVLGSKILSRTFDRISFENWFPSKD